MDTLHPDTGLSPRPEPAIDLYVYPEMPWSGDLNGWSHAFGRETLHSTPPAQEKEQGPSHAEEAGASIPRREELDAQWLLRLSEETRRSEEKGRREGFELGLQRGREELSGKQREEQERLLRQVAELSASFAEERTRYFHQAEEESVRLALAIAARILRREAQMDPLLLTGAARVALGQLAQSTMVRMYVPEEDRPLWQEALARLPNLAHRPEVIGEPAMHLGECRIETELGSADLSLWAQLKEIERGFFDRVGARGVVADPEIEMQSQMIANRYAQTAPTASRTSSTAVQDTSSPVASSSVDESAISDALYAEREW